MDTTTENRIHRLEESQAFLERTIEQLHEEVLALGRRIDSLTSRLAKAEESLASSTGAGGVDDADSTPTIELPPHSHMPVDRQAGRTTDPFAPPSSAEPPIGGEHR